MVRKIDTSVSHVCIHVWIESHKTNSLSIFVLCIRLFILCFYPPPLLSSTGPGGAQADLEGSTRDTLPRWLCLWALWAEPEDWGHHILRTRLSCQDSVWYSWVARQWGVCSCVHTIVLWTICVRVQWQACRIATAFSIHVHVNYSTCMCMDIDMHKYFYVHMYSISMYLYIHVHVHAHMYMYSVHLVMHIQNIPLYSLSVFLPLCLFLSLPCHNRWLSSPLTMPSRPCTLLATPPSQWSMY